MIDSVHQATSTLNLQYAPLPTSLPASWLSAAFNTTAYRHAAAAAAASLYVMLSLLKDLVLSKIAHS